jgi:hypothetical protein
VVVSFACLALLLHSANLIHRARADGCRSLTLICSTQRGPWGVATGDFPSYRSVALDILARGSPAPGVFRASYFRRTPGFPLMLAISYRLTGDMGPAHWFAPLFAAAAAAGAAWMGGAWSGRRRGAVIAGLLFCLWPNSYQYAATFRPDGSHAFLALAALAATLWWRRDERIAAAILSGLLWMGTQLLRPTFGAVAAILPVLLLRRGRSRRYALVSLALWCSTLVAPGFIVGSNWVHHGVPMLSAVGANALGCYAVPRLYAELGKGTFRELRRDLCTAQFYWVSPNMRPRLRARWALSIFRAHPWATARSFLGEMRTQLLAPLQLGPYPKYYPSWTNAGATVMIAFWLAAVAGLVVLGSRDPPLAFFLLLAFGLVMVPAASSTYVGARLRLPLALFSIPLVALLIESVLRVAGRARPSPA